MYIVLVSVLFIGAGCKKKSTDSGNNCLSKLNFTKIAFTDDAGNELSKDTTDWTNESTWCQEEYNLFQTGSVDLSGSGTSQLTTHFFPNPVSTLGSIVVTGQQKCPVQFVVVNRSLQVLDTFSVVYPGTGYLIKTVNFSDSLKYKSGNYYRIYFAAHSTGHLFFYKGHGDLKKG